jgi:hypothetical protein
MTKGRSCKGNYASSDKTITPSAEALGTEVRPFKDYNALFSGLSGRKGLTSGKDTSALIRSDPLCCAQHNGYYVEFRVMLSQGLRGADEDALTLFGG